MAEQPNVPREFASTLQGEADRWVREGLISPAQRDAILGLYPDDGASGRDRTILIFTLLGSLLVGAGVVLFFAANWPALPAAVKVGAIIAAVVGAYGAGYYLQFGRQDYPRLGQALIFLGSLFYGAGVWLVAQIFHLDTHFPTGFLLWGLGALPVVFATGSVWVLYLATLVLVVWTSAEQNLTPQGYNFLFPLLMGGAVLPLARRSRTALAEAGALFGIYLWFMAGAFTHLVPGYTTPQPTILARTLLLYGAGVLTAGLAGLGEERAYLGLGGVMALAGTYILTFDFKLGGGVPSLLAGSAFQTVGVFALVAALGVLGWLGLRRGAARSDLAAAVVVPVVAALSAHLLATTPRMVAANVLLFSGTVGFIVLGIRRRNQTVVNFGLAVFVIHVLTRYFDLFFSAMNRSLFFVVGGVLLLGGGWMLERNRRRWMQNWGGGGNVR